MSKYAPSCKRTGNAPYVRSEHCWGRTTERVIYAANLREAKQQHGWTRMRYTSITMRRATSADLESVQYGWCGCTADAQCEVGS